MKHVLLFPLIFLFALPCYCQENSDGVLSNDTLKLNNGAKFYVGQQVKLGYGSNGAKGFEFIYLSPYSLAGQVKLGSGWANHTMTIKDFKFEGTKRTGKKFYLIMKGGNLSPYWCDVKAAIDQKELMVEGVNDRPTEGKASASLADELEKLKKLYDSGALSKDEYDAAKKKLLN